jgi:hypothetical protein
MFCEVLLPDWWTVCWSMQSFYLHGSDGGSATQVSSLSRQDGELLCWRRQEATRWDGARPWLRRGGARPQGRGGLDCGLDHEGTRVAMSRSSSARAGGSSGRTTAAGTEAVRGTAPDAQGGLAGARARGREENGCRDGSGARDGAGRPRRAGGSLSTDVEE